MAQKMTKRGNLDNEITYEFVCDTTADLQAIDPQYITMGSVATVIQGESGFEVYMANSAGNWINLGSIDSGENTNEQNNNSNESMNQKILQGVPLFIYGTQEHQKITLDKTNSSISGDVLYISNSNSPSSLDLSTKSIQLYDINYTMSGSGPEGIYCGLGWSAPSLGNILIYYNAYNGLMQYTDTSFNIKIAPDMNIPTMNGNTLKTLAFIELNIEDLTHLGELVSSAQSAETEEESSELQIEFYTYIKSKVIEEYDLSNISFLTPEQWQTKYGGE